MISWHTASSFGTKQKENTAEAVEEGEGLATAEEDVEEGEGSASEVEAEGRRKNLTAVVEAVEGGEDLAAAVEAREKEEEAPEEPGEREIQILGKIFTSREQEVFRLLCEGKNNREIGELLFISANTVRNHVYNIYRKAGVKNRIGLLNWAKGVSQPDSFEVNADSEKNCVVVPNQKGEEK